MDSYNSKDFTSMQDDAVRRVREMQKRSRNMVNGEQEENGQNNHAEENGFQNRKNSNGNYNQRRDFQPNFSGHKSNNSDPIKSLLNSLSSKGGGKSKDGELFNIAGIKIDEEKAMIGLLIYILYKQGADVKLLLALGYLLI